MNLPGTRIKNVLQFLNSTLYPIRSTLTQQGFALIPLLILVVIGIGTGVLAIQNGTNFLPQAATRKCSEPEIQACLKRGLPTCVAQEDQFRCNDVYGNTCGIRDSDKVPGIGPRDTVDITRMQITQACPNGCEVNPISQSYACKSTQTTPCNLTGFKDSSGKVIDKLPYGTDTTGCDSEGNWVNYACLGSDYLVPTILESKSSECTQPAAAPANAPTNSTEVPNVKCSDPNHPRCTTNSVKEYGVEKGVCYMINNNLRCAYSQNYKSYDSTGPCNAADNKACINKGGCLLVEVTIKGQGPIKYSICRQDQGTQPASAPASQPQTPPRTSGPADGTDCSGLSLCIDRCVYKGGEPHCMGSNGELIPAKPSTTRNQTSAPDQCIGYTIDGLCIPDFRIGVFRTGDELRATEAQAKLAAARFIEAQTLLDELKGKINDEIHAAAQAKLNAAKAAAEQCKPKQ